MHERHRDEERARRSTSDKIMHHAPVEPVAEVPGERADRIPTTPNVSSSDDATAMWPSACVVPDREHQRGVRGGSAGHGDQAADGQSCGRWTWASGS